jgi:putative endonuclease
MAKQRPLRQQLGQAAEDQACQFLQAKGLVLVTRNFNARQGELDLVMLECDTLVFVEVRYRSRVDFGGASASITRSKQQKIIAAAHYFLHYQSQYAHYAARFDVIAIQAQGQDWHIDWIPAAFLAY